MDDVEIGGDPSPVKETSWERADRAEACRLRLLAAGYIPVPLTGKVPAYASWQNPNPPDPVEIKSWASACKAATNTGVLTRLAPAIDIDVLDGPVANEIADLAAALVGEDAPLLVRFGRHPKRAVLFRAEEPFAKIRTPTFVSPDGLRHHVEILCDGQQLAAFGQHPETGKPYEWPHGEPGDVKRSELPSLSEAMARQFIADATGVMLAAGWRREKPQAKLLDATGAAHKTPVIDAGFRERRYAEAALAGCVAELADTAEGGRNDMLNSKAFRLGTMVARRWIARDKVFTELLSAATACGLHEVEARRTLKSGLDAGEKELHADLREQDATSPVETPGKRSAPDESDADTAATGEREKDEQYRRKPETGTWEEPDYTLLDDRRGELPEFPLDALPPSLHGWLLRAARGAGVTVGHVAVPLLGIASSLLGTARRIQASRSWSEPLSMWVAIVGFSGTGKTPGLDVTRRALSLIERERKPKIAELQREHETRAQKAKAEKKKWEQAVTEAVEANQPAPPKPAAAMDPGPFVAPRLCLSDSTIERIAVLLEARPQGLAFAADELARLFLNMKRYSGGQDNEFWLEAWNGKNFVVERQGRPPVVLDYLLVGVTGGFQPDKLARAFEGDDDGMYARFCFAWPEEPPHMPLSNEVAEIEPEIQNALTRIIDLPADAEGVFVPKTVGLTPDAVATFETFRTFLHQVKAELDGREREWVAKGGTHVLRLSGTLAYLDWAMLGGAEPQAIGEEYVKAAVRLWQGYFWPHSRAALRQIGLTEKHTNSRRVLRWIQRNRKIEQDVSLLDIRREALGRRLDAEQTRSVVDALTRAGWLNLVTRKTAGRSVHRWQVNPRLFSEAHTAERSERSESGQWEE